MDERGYQIQQSVLEYIDTVEEELESSQRDELLSILKQSEFCYSPTGEFGQQSWHYKEYIDIKAPMTFVKVLRTKYTSYLYTIVKMFYKPEGDYEYWGINILPQMKKMQQRVPTVINAPTVIESKDVVYDNLKLQVVKNNYDSIQGKYLLEACECGIKGCKLATATMVGCAAERLLILLCVAYLTYLNNNPEMGGAEKFEREVLGAKKAHTRLDGFTAVTRNQRKFFESLGFENHELNLSFLDIIRQVRNDAGHPTGIEIEADRLQTIISNYSLLYDQIGDLIKKLKVYKNEP